MQLTPEYAAIVFLFTALYGFGGLVMKALWTENKELKQKLNESNEASRDLIALQAQLLRGRGVKVIETPPEGT